MKYLFALALLLANAVHARDLRPELFVLGRVYQISMSPAGSLWIGTAAGQMFRSDDGGRSWSEAEVAAQRVDVEKQSLFGDVLEQVTYFDAQRAMVSGYIGDEKDRILVTGDGGRTWKSVRLPVKSFWAYDAQAMGDGHAWLGGSSNDVLRSDDFGRTWRALAPPFADDRTSTVWFETPQAGVVGSHFSGELAITRDGGASWQKFEAKGRDQVVSGCGKARDKRITKARMRQGRVIVAQCGGVFGSPVAAPRAWTRVTAGGRPLVDFELAEDGRVIGVTDDRRVFAGDRSLDLRLQHPPVAIVARGNRIAVLDSTLKVAVFDGGWHVSRMFGKGIATKWPITSLDRGADDVLWGISRWFLYRSTDGAKTWDRIAELPVAAERLLMQDDGNLLLTDGRGWVVRWETGANRLVQVPGLNGLDIASAFRRKDVWLVWGGRQFDTAGRVEVAQTFVSGQFAGSVGYGFVAASVDGGRTWRVIDRWNEEGPQTLFLSDDNRLTILSWLCGVRQGRITLAPPSATMQTLFSGRDREHAPYVQSAKVLDLLGGNEGWLVGWIHHVGDLIYRTVDGGRSWTGANEPDYPRIGLYRLFDGTWIGFAPPFTLQRWTGKKFEKLVSIPEGMTDTMVDSRGSLLLRFKDGTVRVLDAKSGSLRAIARND